MNRSFQKRNDQGFSLMELMIAVAIIGVLTGFIIPAYYKNVAKANEANAITTLNAIRTEQIKYAMDHNGEFGSFQQLYKEGYLDRRFDSDRPTMRGYIFTIQLIPKTRDKSANYTINADPEQPEGITATGTRFFYMDANTRTTANTEEPATANDNPI
jgi:prepilin-type N-terminal cleavage/methylation domain-containing protein